MREGSPNQFSITDPVSGSRTAAKSLFWKILAASPCGSRFCGDSEGYPLGKFFRIRILGDWAKKNVRGVLRVRHPWPAGTLHFTDCTGGACGWGGPSARSMRGPQDDKD